MNTTRKMEHIRNLTNLKNYDLDTLHKLFHTKLDYNGYLKRSEYNQVFKQIVQSSSITNYTNCQKREIEQLIDSIFELYDYDNSGSVKYTDLHTGFSILIISDRQTKIKNCWSLISQNYTDLDPILSFNQLTEYLTAIYKMLYLVDNTMETKLSISPEELASITAEDVIKYCDCLDTHFSQFLGYFQEDNNYVNKYLNNIADINYTNEIVNTNNSINALETKILEFEQKISELKSEITKLKQSTESHTPNDQTKMIYDIQPFDECIDPCRDWEKWNEKSETKYGKNYYPDMAFQLRGEQTDYDRVKSHQHHLTQARVYQTIRDEINTLYADKAYQLRGLQTDYDHIMAKPLESRKQAYLLLLSQFETVFAEKAFELKGDQKDYDRVMSVDVYLREQEYQTIESEFQTYYADLAYQVNGSQKDYDQVMSVPLKDRIIEYNLIKQEKIDGKSSEKPTHRYNLRSRK